jgi:transposase
MAFHYVGGERDQLFLLPVNMRDWLDEGHLAWFVLDVVERVDLSKFHAHYRLGGAGRPPYDPKMMLALLFYAYATGMRSSRRIEAACRTDAAFRVIAGGATPDHATLAQFVVDHEAALKDVFFDVLRLCAAAGLVPVERLALDGTKMAADAALDQNRSAQWVREEVARVVADAIATDVAEASQLGLLGFEDLPVDLGTKAGRVARLNAALAQIEAAEAAARAGADEKAAQAHAAAAEGRKLNVRKPKDPQARLARAEADHAAAVARAEAKAHARAAKEQAAQARGRTVKGFAPRPDTSVERAAAALEAARAAAQDASGPEPEVANVTDPDSRMMKTPDGFVQGYNAQVMVNTHQVVVAHEVTQDANDVGQFTPMVTATEGSLARVGVAEPIGLVTSDAGYWSEANASAPGPDRLIATQKDWKQRRAARELGTTTGPPPEDASPLEAMEHRLRTPDGAAAYSTRSHTVEPVFANSKENRGFRRFRRRGLGAARSEWSLMMTVHNLGKLRGQLLCTGATPAVT